LRLSLRLRLGLRLRLLLGIPLLRRIPLLLGIPLLRVALRGITLLGRILLRRRVRSASKSDHSAREPERDHHDSKTHHELLLRLSCDSIGESGLFPAITAA
jgi:hypothetical protein